MTLLIMNFRKYAGSRLTSYPSILARQITWCPKIHHSTKKFIDTNQDIDILNDSESTSSRDVENAKLNIKLMVCMIF